MDELVGIGEFAARSGLSARMLRSYAAAGVLVPAAVDRSSGYRYYSVGQLQMAALIAALRRADVPVAEIGRFLDHPTVEAVERWERALERQTARRRDALRHVRSALALDVPAVLVGSPRSPEDPPYGGLVMPTDRIGFATHQGGRPTNQDAILVSEHLAAVADGLGGLDDGEVASRLALDVLGQSFDRDLTERGLLSACHEANRAVWEHSHGRMGTTIVALGMVPDGSAVVAHAGDSRLYRLSASVLEQVTHDHSVVADLVRAGHLTADQAAEHPQRNVLTRAVGVAPALEVDVSPVPAISGDRWLLCTDGLFKALDEARIESVLRAAGTADEAAKALVAASLDCDPDDNVTAVVVDPMISD